MRATVVMVAVAAFVLAACGSDDTVVASPADEADGAEVQAEPEAEPAEPEPGAEPAEPEPTGVEEEPLNAPATVTAPIGVDYTATGSIGDSWTLIVGAEFDGGPMAVFSTVDVTMYVQEEHVTVCPTGERCIRFLRETFEQLGLTGGRVIEEAMSFAADVPFTSASNDTIAGREVRCLDVDDDDLRVYCYDLESGIALRWAGVDEGVETLIEATRVFVPTEDDLRPPDQVEDMTDLDLGGFDLGGFDPDTFDPTDLEVEY